MAATLRPETMFGQTNCWVLPDGAYGAYAAAESGAVYVMSARAARNLGFQDGLDRPGEQEPLATVSGRDLLGLPLKVWAALGDGLAVKEDSAFSCSRASLGASLPVYGSRIDKSEHTWLQ